MDHEANTGSVQRAIDKFSLELGRFAGDMELALSRMGEIEKLLGLCAFILVLMLLIVRRANRKARSGSTGFQFAIALGIVVIFSFGIGWLFDGNSGLSNPFNS